MDRNSHLITIHHCQPSRLLPEDAKDEVFNTIGSKWAKDTKSLLMGISEDERNYLLPSITSVKPSSDNWEESVKNFFANLAIRVDEVSGLQLNIATYKKTVTFDGVTKEVDYPVVPMDYIMYKQCLADVTVASNKDQTRAGIYKFYIEDKLEEQRKEIAIARDEDRITQLYLDLVKYDNDTESYKNEEKMRHVLHVLGRNPDVYELDMQAKLLKEAKDQAIAELKTGVTFAETQFVAIVSDPKLQSKAFIQALIAKEILKWEGEFIVDRLNPSMQLGRGLVQAALWIDNPENTQQLQSYMMKFKSKKKQV